MLQKVINVIAGMLLGLFALMLLGAVLGPGSAGWKGLKILLFGWVMFLQRTLPNVNVNWTGVGMVLLCSVVILGILHWFCKWLYRPGNPAASRSWSWRWTFALFASLWLTFGIVMGASGALRHIRWLANSDEPLYRKGINPSDFYMTSLEVRGLLEGAEWDAERLDAHLMSMTGRGGPLGSWDQYQFLFLTTASNRVSSVLIVPRDPDMQRRFGFHMSSEGGKTIAIEQLPNYILSK